MPAPDNAKLREYGHLANRDVLANTFNPKASLFANLEYVQKIAERACRDSESAFGRMDPLHIESLINFAIFFLRRRKDPLQADLVLSRATEILAKVHDEQPLLLAEMLAARVLVQVERDRGGNKGLSVASILSDTIPSAFKVEEHLPAHVRSVLVYRHMVQIALGSSHNLLPYLVSEAGRPLALELAAGDVTEQAAEVLHILLPLLIQVWAPDAYQVECTMREVAWLAPGGMDQFGRLHALERLGRDLISVTWSNDRATDGPPNLRAAWEAYRGALRHAQRIIEVSASERDSLVEEGIETFEAVVRELDKALAAENQPVEHAGAVMAVRISTLSALAGLYFARNDDEGRDLERARESLIQAMDVLHSDSSRAEIPDVVADSGMPLKAILKRAEKFVKDVFKPRPVAASDYILAVDIIRVRLAEVFSMRLHGDMEENMNEILVHTDSLDIEKENEPYYWALGKYLRGLAYGNRQETKSFVGAKPAESFERNFDMNAASHFFRDVLDVFTESQFPWEWALTVLQYSIALTPRLDDNVPTEAKLGLAAQLWEAEKILSPVSHPSAWTAIQLQRARVAGALGSGAEQEFRDHPLDILFRAQAFLKKGSHPQLYGQIELEIARLFARSPADATRQLAYGHYTNCLSLLPGLERFTVLSELGNLYFFNRQFPEAAHHLSEALELGELRLGQGGSMHARRMAVLAMEGLSTRLSYCLYQTGRMNEAVATLDDGKARLLRDSMATRRADLTLLDEKSAARGERLRDEILRLESESFGGMGWIEDMRRLIEARAEFRALVSDLRDVSGAGQNLHALASIPATAAIVMPLVSMHGGVVFILTPAMTSVTSQHIIPLPDLTEEHVQSWLFEENAGWFPAFGQRNDGAGEQFKSVLNQTSKVLWESLMGPVCARLRDLSVKEIIFVPSSGLQLLPIHAAGIEGGKCLVDEFRFRSVPSAAIFQLLQRPGEQADRAEKGLIAGVSVYSDEELSPLENVKNEVRIIANEFGVDPLVEGDVTSGAISENLGLASLVHLACHGSPWAEDPSFGKSFRPKPVLRFAEGGVSLPDILVNWDMRGIQLVTLSACDTGLVDFSKPWDQFEGLPNVLLQAGARSVVGSLWSVDDESTALLMARFYRNLKRRNMDTASALSEAQRWLRDSGHASLKSEFPDLYNPDPADISGSPDERPFSHQYFWAPFFLTG